MDETEVLPTRHRSGSLVSSTPGDRKLDGRFINLKRWYYPSKSHPFQVVINRNFSKTTWWHECHYEGIHSTLMLGRNTTSESLNES